MHNQETVLENETHKILRFWDTNGSPNPDQKTKPNIDQEEKKEVSIS